MRPNAAVLDWLAIVPMLGAGWLLREFRRRGVKNLPRTRRALTRLGVFPIIDHYYEPLFNPRHLRHSLAVERELPGLDLREADQLELLRSLRWTSEIERWPTAELPGIGRAFPLADTQYGPGDAEFLYSILRTVRPRKVLEIGCGGSSKIIQLAVRATEAESGIQCRHICVEPYENPWLEELGIEVIRARIEDTELSLFSALEEGDLLFIDSSHMIRPQGDVLFEFQSIIPRLRKGVLVHVHDIFTPRDYPASWVVDKVKFWNEQYLLEVMLAGSVRYEVVAALNFLKHRHFEALRSVCPFLLRSNEPGAFYFRIK
ncbi:MAG: hypothetical protein RI967_1517 [Planctomycetota bacterium]|jgi:predicted O-methyltransferase YrrM